MILLYPRVTIDPGNPTYTEIVQTIGFASGICYNADTASKGFSELEEYVKKRIAAKHESVLEHRSLSVIFDVDRGVTHELVRHRLCAFTQSSTRYIDYAGEREDGQCRFIIPPWVGFSPKQYEGSIDLNDFEKEGFTRAECEWFGALLNAEKSYRALRKPGGWRPEQARSILPNATMARIMVTANVREWQHILRLRAIGTTGKPHPQMVEVMVPLLMKFAELYPIFFKPLLEEHIGKSLYGMEKPEYYRTEVL